MEDKFNVFLNYVLQNFIHSKVNQLRLLHYDLVQNFSCSCVFGDFNSKS